MTSSAQPRRWDFTLRLEDGVALAFFLVFLSMRIIFRQSQPGQIGAATDMALVGVAALFLKEVFHQALSGKSYRATSAEDLKEFAHPYWEIARDWFPFVVILAMYYSLDGDATHLLVRRDQDAALIALDQKLFALQASVALQRFITPPLTAWMRFNYSMHLLYIPLVAGFIYLRRPRAQFRRMMCGLVTLCFFGFLGYLLVPAVGPKFALSGLYHVPLTQSGAVFSGPAGFMDMARIQRDSFPSMHVAISFLIWIYAGINSRRLFWILSPFILSLWVSTVYLRYHYVVDCIAGLLLAPACFFLANWLFSKFADMPCSIALPEKVVEWLPRRRAIAPGEMAEESRQPS